MKVKGRVEDQLILEEMRQRIAELETADAERWRVEEALRESEGRYRLLAENVTDVIWTMDMNLHFTYISPSVTRQRGYSVEEAMAQTLLEETLTPASREVAMEALAEELAAEGKGQSDPNRSRKLELELSCKGGSTVWAEIEMTFLRDSDDRPVGILGVARDISERKGAQEALRKAYCELEMRVKERTAELTRANESLHAEIAERQRAEEEIKMLSAVAEQSTEGMAIAGLDGNLTFINKAWCRMHGYKSPKELLGKSLAIFHNKEQIENDVKPFNERVIKLGAHSGEVGHITKDGKPFPTLMTTTLLKDKQGKPYALAGIAKDITERKRAEETLRESEEKYRRLLGDINDGYLVIQDEKVIMANERAAEIYGVLLDEYIGSPLGASLPADVQREVRERYRRRIAGEAEPERYELITATGVTVEVNDRLIDYEGRPAVAAVVRDITERKRTEETLRQAEQEKTAILSSMSELVALQDAEMRILWANRAVSETTGVPLDQLLGRFCYEVRYQRSEPCDGCPVARARETGRPEEGEVATPDGRAWLIRGYPILDASGNIKSIVKVGEDFTERKRAEVETEARAKELASSQEKYRRLLGDINDGYLVVQDEKVIMANERAAEIYGVPLDEFIGSTLGSSFPPDVQEEVRERFRRRIAGEAEPERYELTTATGIAVEVNGKLIDYEGRPAVAAVVRDISERKRAEEEIQRSYQIQVTLSTLLQVSLLDIPLEAQLELILQHIVSIPWLTLESRGGIFLVEDEAQVLVMKAQYGLNTSLLDMCAQVPFGRCLCGRAAVSGKVEFADHVDDRHENRYEGISPHGHYCVPILSVGKVLGIINLYIKEGHCRDESEEEFLRTAANVLAGIIERKRAEEGLQRSFGRLQRALDGTVEALAQISETKDPYTANHQRGVAQLATAIAKEMGFEEDQLEGLRVAGMLHDIGKIYVPAEILSKPGRLSEPEFNMIKAHAQLGHDILKVIEFRWPIAQMVLQHHERMNGSGYPSGLSGESILLEARLLAVADVVDAMTHHRPYRPARGIDKAMEEISKNSGILYDAAVVDACLKLLGGQGRQLYEAGDLAMHRPMVERTLDIHR